MNDYLIIAILMLHILNIWWLNNRWEKTLKHERELHQKKIKILNKEIERLNKEIERLKKTSLTSVFEPIEGAFISFAKSLKELFKIKINKEIK